MEQTVTCSVDVVVVVVVVVVVYGYVYVYVVVVVVVQRKRVHIGWILRKLYIYIPIGRRLGIIGTNSKITT